VAWNNVAIVDPLVTLTLLAGLIWAARAGTSRPARVALAASLAYLGFGVLQNQRALDAQAQIATARGHVVERGAALPAIGNNLVWRSLYQSGGHYYADRIRVNWGGGVTWQAGSVLTPVTAAEFRTAPARVQKDFARFAHFSDGWVARDPDDARVLGDARYSLDTRRFAPIWGIRFEPDAASPTRWINRTAERRLPLAAVWQEVIGDAPAFTALPAR
jgi:inner membrane protein